MQLWDDNLTLKKELNAHEAYVYAIAVDTKGRLYTTSCDGTLKMVKRLQHFLSFEFSHRIFFLTV
jgi:hypothetical protein